MTVRQILIVALIVVAASSLSAIIAYRSGARGAGAPPGSGPSTAPPLNSSAAVTSGAERGDAGRCVGPAQAGSHVGEDRCVSARILRVFTSRAGNTFLDFCADYRNCPFTSVIFSSDRTKFGDLATLGGRRVEIEGQITSYQGRAEIVIHDPKQVRVLP